MSTLQATTTHDFAAWSVLRAAPPPTPLELLLAVSRRIGERDDLALHGGGNTSVKDGGTLWVKASGRDLRRARAADFTPVDLGAARRLLAISDPDDAGLAPRLAAATLQAGASAPSIETLSHAALPHR